MTRRTKRYWAKRRRRVKLRLERAADKYSLRARDRTTQQYREMCGRCWWPRYPKRTLVEWLEVFWPQGDLGRHFHERRNAWALMFPGSPMARAAAVAYDNPEAPC